MSDSKEVKITTALDELTEPTAIAHWSEAPYQVKDGYYRKDGLWNVAATVEVVDGKAKFVVSRYTYWQREGASGLVEVSCSAGNVKKEFEKAIRLCLEKSGA